MSGVIWWAVPRVPLWSWKVWSHSAPSQTLNCFLCSVCKATDPTTRFYDGIFKKMLFLLKLQKHVSADVEVSKKGCDVLILHAKHFIITLLCMAFFLLLCNGSKAVKAAELVRFMCPLENAWQWSYSNKPFIITVQGSFLFGVILFVIIHSMRSQSNNIYSAFNPLNLHYHIWGNKNINKHIRSIKVLYKLMSVTGVWFSAHVTAQDCLTARGSVIGYYKLGRKFYCTYY